MLHELNMMMTTLISAYEPIQTEKYPHELERRTLAKLELELSYRVSIYIIDNLHPFAPNRDVSEISAIWCVIQ